MSRRTAVWTMVLAAFLWSIAGVVTRQLHSAQSFEVTFWRSMFTALSLALYVGFAGGLSAWRTLPWRNGQMWLSALCWGVMFTAFMLALTLTKVANVLVATAIGPFLTALLARVWLGQRLSKLLMLSLLIATLGLGVMFVPQLDAQALAASRDWLGITLALCVPCAAAVQWTLAQNKQAAVNAIKLEPQDEPKQTSHETRFTIPATVMLGGLLSAAVTLPLALPLKAVNTDVAWLALLGVAQLAVPCVVALWCARVLPAAEVSMLALLEIVFGIALVTALTNEALPLSSLLGAALVLAALALRFAGEQWLQARHNSTPLNI